MRRLTLSFLVVSVFLVTVLPLSAIAGEDAGKVVDDSIYVDSKFGFSFVKPDTWKFKDIHGNKDIERVLLLKKAPVIPAQFSNARSLFTVPQVTILADETEMTPREYRDFFLDDDKKDDLKKKAYSKFIILQIDSKYYFEPTKKRSAKVGGHHAVKIVGKKQYSYLSEETGTISDFISAYIYIIEADNGLILMECVGEREMWDVLEPEFDMLIDGFSFAEEDEPSEDTETGEETGGK